MSVTQRQCRVYGLLCRLAASAGFADLQEDLGSGNAPRVVLASPRRAALRDIYTVRPNGTVSCTVQRASSTDFRLVDPTPEAIEASVRRSARELLGKEAKS